MPKPIIITDDSVVNDLGFRVMTDGGDYSDYLKNPIMLFDHTRRNGANDEDIILPIGTMTDLVRQGSKLVATPVFDEEDDFAVKVKKKYDKGILNMASIGFEALDWSEDPSMMLPGQMMPTVTKWKLKEISITDIGSNPNCCKLSHGTTVLQLSAKTKPEDIQNFFNSNKPLTSMKKVITVLTASGLVQLSEAATEELVAESVKTIIHQLSAKDSVIASKDAEILKLQNEAKASATKALTERATTLVEGALSAKKIVAEQKDNFVKLASASEDGYTSVKGLIDSLKSYEPVMQTLSNQQAAAASAHYTSLKDEFEKRAVDGSLENLKASNIEHFKQVYKAGTGKDYKF